MIHKMEGYAVFEKGLPPECHADNIGVRVYNTTEQASADLARCHPPSSFFISKVVLLIETSPVMYFAETQRYARDWEGNLHRGKAFNKEVDRAREIMEAGITKEVTDGNTRL